MKFQELTIRNFGPYKGEQSIEFPQDPNTPVMVIFGENMRGKTSLLNSLRWVLYGNALDRHGKPIETHFLLNSDAFKEGDYQISVSLRFEAEGSVYELTRRARPLDLISVPKKGSDFETNVMMRLNGKAMASDRIEFEINKFVPEDIARFYLFDAELLQQYETLLREDSSQQQEIKESIEKILGVPALIRGRDDAHHLLKKAQNLLAKESKNVEELESHSKQSLQLQDEIKVHEQDLIEMETHLITFNDEIEQINSELLETQSVQRVQKELDDLDKALNRHRQRERALTEERNLAVKGAWKDLLQPCLEIKNADTLRKLQDHQKDFLKTGSLQEKIAQLKSILENSKCAVCGQEIADSKRESFGSQLGDLEVEIARSKSKAEDMAKLSETLNSIRKLAPTGALPALVRLERDLESNALEMTRIESEIENQKESLRGHDTARIAQIAKKRDGLLELRGQQQIEIRNIKKIVEEKTSKVSLLSRLMTDNPRFRKNRNSRQVEVYNGLGQIFGRSVDRLRERMRDRVASEATEAFLELTTEKTYKRLVINSNYGLTIIDSNDREVSVRSAGAEQIVAMSLLSALNKTADRKAAVVIDTPFGRLDPSHRLNILKYVPKMADQVVFLVHEGEINRTNGLDPVAQAVGARYEIERVSSSQSRLRRIHE
jgi:DNA sulfur modification protein DndD